MEIIAWIGFSQALFSGFLTLTKKEQSIADKLLTAWLFLLAIEFLTFALESKIFPNFVLLTNSFLLFNPALYLYTCSLTNENFHLQKRQLFHLVPYLFFKIFAWVVKEPQQLETFFNADKTLWFRVVFGLTGVISWIVYLSLSSIQLTRHRKKIKHEFSTIDTFKKIGWLFFILVTYILYCCSAFIWALFDLFFFDTSSVTLFNYSVLLFFIYILGFYGLKQTPLFTTEEQNQIPDNQPSSSFLSVAAQKEIISRLLAYFENEKPYLNPDLNMSLLASKLQIPKHRITEVLNGSIGKNFFLFVNEYRIEAVKKMLSDPENMYSIEAIGYECGFNSKSTFFSVFKKLTGLTPAEYKKSGK